MDDIARLRNVAVVGPHHAGKTTLVEALLAHCGAIPRRGSVRDGTTTTDGENERRILLEALADFDDTLMEELLDGKDPSQDEIERDLCEDCAHDQIVPVLVGSAQESIGVSALVDAMAQWFPSPETEPRKDVDGRAVTPRA